jgi:hypothetical protein
MGPSTPRAGYWSAQVHNVSFGSASGSDYPQVAESYMNRSNEAIRVYDRLLLILSDASMNSEWIKTKIANAITPGRWDNRPMVEEREW